MSERLFHQGSGDMLCGLYCAAHLIACFKVKNKNPRNQMDFYVKAAELALQRLAESAQRLKLLTAEHLFEPKAENGGGFNDMALQRIFNGLEVADRENLRAIAFSSKRLKHLWGAEYLKGSHGHDILAQGARAVVNQSRENHWVTVEGRHPERGYVSYDPSLDDPKSLVETIPWKRGGIFVAEPEVIRYIYAQTH
ncbi:hypothetical protein GRI40_02230 [Altererythrobacter aerius]|uniref:Uncharacterized protein n=1 Tax=Tsuneonella aeria TaxID=1837929 RepID=A0A6I4TCA4_9SPHN|nr:hypothetical protein [Tsuneonella aeria]MXO74038.1 hypothetical protein [Tsuneonella aeria]